MKFRKLRIAFSVTCGVICLLLIVLWVRSYWWHDIVFKVEPGDQVTAVRSSYGTAYFARMVVPPRVGRTSAPLIPHGWRIRSSEANEVRKQFAWRFTPGNVIVMFPH